MKMGGKKILGEKIEWFCSFLLFGCGEGEREEKEGGGGTGGTHAKSSLYEKKMERKSGVKCQIYPSSTSNPLI